MKKFLSLIMALVMVGTLTSAALAANYKDVDKDYKNYNAIEVLDTLGVIHGFNENIFGPEGELTRAQLCAMLVRAFYGEYDFHFNNTTFKDVPLNHWARVYIDTAVTYGLMNGYSKDYFGPEDKLTYTQAARVILNALGYGKLDWPHGVNLIAYELGLYNNIHGVILDNGVCTRAHAAQMIYNAFNCKLVEEYSDSYFATDNNFLNNLLGYKESSIKKNDGHTYLSYKDSMNKEYITDIALTHEKEIKINNLGNQFKFLSNKYFTPIEWNKVSLIRDGELVFATGCPESIKNQKVIGIFDDDDNLVAIKYETAPIVITPNSNLNQYPKLKKMLNEDKNYKPYYSTITYWDKKDMYEISNKTAEGYLTKVECIEYPTHYVELSNGFSGYIDHKTGENFSVDANNYIRIFIDYQNNPVDYIVINK